MNATAGVAEASVVVLSTSSTLSAIGDLALLLTFFLSAEARHQPTTRLIIFLAAADLLGEFPVVGSFALPVPVYTWGEFWCTLQAAGNWYAQMATWLWTMAYAHHIAANINHPHLRLFQPLREYVFHVLCWGLPACAITLALGLGLLGRSDDGSNTCSIRSSSWSMGFYALLWLALLYNALVFFLVHRAMRIVLRANAVSTDEQAASEMANEMRRRLDALGARFLLYIATFVGSQLPCALRHILVASLGKPELWCNPTVWYALSLVADGLCPLHGFLNALVYGFSARGIDHRCGCSGNSSGGGGLFCAWGGGGGGLISKCNPFARARFYMRQAWRGRTSTDYTTESEEANSMAAPLVDGAV